MTKSKQLTKDVKVTTIENFTNIEELTNIIKNNNVELFVSFDPKTKERKFIVECKKLNFESIACESFFEAKFFCNPDGNNEVVNLDFDTKDGKKANFFIPIARASFNNIKNIIK